MAEKTGTKVSFEEALTMTGFGRFNIKILLICSSVISAMAFETASVAYLVPANACELQTTSAQQGFMGGIPLVGVLVSSNIWGYLADTKGRKKVLVIALIMGFVAGCAATLSPNWQMFSFLKFLSSSSMAGCYGLGNAFLSECTPERRRFPLIQLLCSIYLLSVGSMAAMAIPILPMTFSYYVPYLDIHINSWRLLNIVYSIPCLIAAISIFFAHESPKFLLSVKKDDEALRVLAEIYASNYHDVPENYKVSAVTLNESRTAATGFWSSVVSQTTPLIKPPLLKTTLLLSVLFVAVYICFNPYTVWLPFMADGFMKSLEKGEEGLTFCQMLRSAKNVTTETEQEQNCSLNDTAMIMVFGMDILLATANLFFSVLVKLLGRRNLLISLQLVSGVTGLCVNFSTLWPLTAFMIIVYFSGVLNFGVLSTFSCDLFPTYVKAMGVCLTLMIGRGSAVLGINLLKNLLENNCEFSFYLFGGITILGGFIGFLLPSDKKDTPKDPVKEAPNTS